MTNEKNYEPVRLKCNGATKDFPFDFQVHKNSKTLKYNDLIVALINRETKEETILTENTDYTISAGRVGGNITTNIAYSEIYDIEISRKTSHFQEKNFSTSSGFQASEVENSLDRVSCSLQDMDYNIENFKSEYSAEINKKIDEFKDEVNTTIDEVREAAEKVNELEAAAEVATSAATAATSSAESAKNAADEAASAADNAVLTLNTRANTDLSNLSEAGEAHFDDKFNARANLDLSNLSEAGEARFDEKVNTDLSNLSDTGKGVFNYYVGFPDLGAAVSKSWNTDYTAEENGWVRTSGYGVSGNSINLYINGVGAHAYSWNDSNGATYLWFPVLKGQTYKATGAYNSQSLMFYPFKKGV